MIALPTKKREIIANTKNITANTTAAALRFLILFESERAISSERISVVSFAIVGKSLCKWRYVSLHFSQDSFGTAANVTGDQALALIVDEVDRKSGKE